MSWLFVFFLEQVANKSMLLDPIKTFSAHFFLSSDSSWGIMGNVISFDGFINRAWDAGQNFAWEFGVRHAAYVYQLEDNLKALQTAVGDVRTQKKDVMRRVRLEKQASMTREMLPSVETWLSRVATATSKGDELVKEGQRQVDRLCLGGICSTSYFSTSSFGGDVVHCIGDLDRLKNEDLAAVTGETPPEKNYGAKKNDDPTVGLEPKLCEVLSCLGKEEVGMVGVYGIGGVGKTTLLQQINNHFLSNSDSLVIWVDVSQNFELSRIQLDIGEKLGFAKDWNEKSLEKRATDMFHALCTTKFILLLDDLWQRVELATIGVPLSNNLNGSKIVFTTRQMEVCTQMEPQSSINIETLEWEQAWILFQKKVTEGTINSHPEIPPLAQKVARKCDGLPLALCVIGLSMSSMRQPQEWTRAIKILERPAGHYSQGDLGMANLFSLLRFSYDNLKSERIKSCFLYCALFPEDHRISKEKLVELWICENVLIDCEDDYDDEIDVHYEGYSIIGTLVRASLLEDGGDWVKMHDVVRGMALWIGEMEMLGMAGMEQTKAPTVRKWEKMNRVSLMQNNIEELTEQPSCPNLATLFLSRNAKLHSISNGFFDLMGALTVLDLSRTAIAELPGSMSKLVLLQYLDISYTKISELPILLTKLAKLKYLDISGLELKVKSEQVIHYLSCLQVLKMMECGLYYAAVLNENSSPDDVILLEELQCLKRVNSLDITLQSGSGLEKLLEAPQLVTITKGLFLTHFEDEYSMEGLFRSSASLRYKSFNSIESLFAVSCSKLQDLTCIVLMPNLRKLVVKNCHSMKEIIRGDVRFGQDVNPCPHLVSLELWSLQDLTSIYPGALPFPSLRKWYIGRCRNLKRLPLDANSAAGPKIRLSTEKHWWDSLEWEDEAAKVAMLSRLKCNFVVRAIKRNLVKRRPRNL